MKSAKSIFPILSLVFALAPVAHAQFGSGIVYDPTQSAHAIEQIEQGSQKLQKAEQIYTTTYKTMNQVIATYNLAYQMSKMPQNLAARYKSDFSMWTNFSSASAPNTYGNTSAWINALDLGNPTRAASAYNGAVIQLQSYPSGALSSQDATTQAAIQNQYASSEIGQATLTNSLSTLGTINSATLLQIHSQQDTNQILAAQAAQQALSAKEQLDERNWLINESIYFQQNFPNVMQQTTGGITDAVQSISLSPNGR